MNDRVARAYERAEDQLAEDFNSGFLSREEFNREMRELARDYAAEAEEAAREAYEAELDRW